MLIAESLLKYTLLMLFLIFQIFNNEQAVVLYHEEKVGCVISVSYENSIFPRKQCMIKDFFSFFVSLLHGLQAII